MNQEDVIEYRIATKEEINMIMSIALNNGKVVACASMSYIEMMPTFSHPTGNRAHLQT